MRGNKVRIRCAVSRPRGVVKLLRISSGVCEVGLPWAGRRWPGIQLLRVKWKVGPEGRWTMVRPVGFLKVSVRRMTEVYLRLVKGVFWSVGMRFF